MNTYVLQLRPIVVLAAMLCLLQACNEGPKTLEINASPVQAANRVDTVFVGHVVSIDTRPQLLRWAKGELKNLVDRDVYRLTAKTILVIEVEVKEAFKGAEIGRETVIAFPVDEICGLDPAPDQEYLIYAYRRPNGLHTNACMRTVPVAAAKEEVSEIREYFSSNTGPTV